MKSKAQTRFFSILILFVFLSACSGRDPFSPFASSQTYFCDQNRQLVLSLGDQGKSAAIAFDGRNITLSRVTDDRYTNSIYTLYIDGDRIVVEREGVPVFTDCKNGP